MSNRLDKEREARLQPKRVNTAVEKLTQLGYEVEQIGETTVQFTHNGEKVLFYPYSGWHTGKSIKDGRGLKKLLNQLETQPKKIITMQKQQTPAEKFKECLEAVAAQGSVKNIPPVQFEEVEIRIQDFVDGDYEVVVCGKRTVKGEFFTTNFITQETVNKATPEQLAAMLIEGYDKEYEKTGSRKG